MSSYIIAGSADSIDTAYCQEIARRIKAKYKNIDFRVVIKHPSEWEEYLQQICRIYGFLKKSNPIIYTFDGKIIGNKEAFMAATAKYFGLDQDSLIVQNLTNQVNMKIATQEINRKKINKNNIKTHTQKIETQYENLLKKNILKHQLKDKKQYLTNGIEYIYRTVKGLVPNIKFTKKKEVQVQVEEVIVSDIDLMMISQNDQIKVQEQPNTTPVPQGKQAFVTANQKNNSEHDRMSEASRTNKMHESIISYDKDSKQMKESSKSKLRIDQQIDDVPDYIDQPMEDVTVTELPDGFYVAFLKNTHITGEMIFYHNEDPNQNLMRAHNDGRPVKGHRVLIKQIHFDGENALLEGESRLLNKNQGNEQKQIESSEQFNDQDDEHQRKAEGNKNEGSVNQIESKKEMEKIRTQPVLPLANQVSNKNIINDDDALSQIQSDLNLISHLNYHTLYVLKPLSPMQLKNLHYFVNETDSIGCLQFLAENPNPKVKLYHRKILLETQKQDKFSLLLPVQKFIEKQLEDMQFTKIQVPNEKCFDYEPIENEDKFQLLQINDLGFEHYLYQLTPQFNFEKVSKMLKYTIDQMLSLEGMFLIKSEQLKKEIGYNLIFTKKFILIVPLSEPYQIYNENKLFFDGLAYLGFIHTADVIQPYQLHKKQIKNVGSHLRKLLNFCANGKNQELLQNIFLLQIIFQFFFHQKINILLQILFSISQKYIIQFILFKQNQSNDNQEIP